MSKNSSRTIFRRNVSWQFVGSATQAALGGIVLLVMGRSLGAAGFGEYSIIIGFITVANLLMEPRMQDVAARVFWNLHGGAEVQPGHREAFVDLVVFESVAKLLPLMGLALLARPLANVSGLEPDGALLVLIAAAGNFLAKIGYGVSSGLLRVLGRSDQFTFCGSGELLARLLVLLTLAGLGKLTVASSVLVLSTTLVLSNLAQLYLAARQLGGMDFAFSHWNPKSWLSRLRPHRRLVFSNIGLSAADLMNKDLDITLLSPVMPAATIGVYKMAKNIALLTWRAVDPFYLALMPELSRRVMMGDHAGTYSLIRRSVAGLSVLAITLSASAYLGVWLFGERLFGTAFAGIPHLLGWMLIGIVGSAPLVWGHPLAVALNRGDTAFVGSLLGSAVGITAFLLLVGSFGIEGAAVAWSLSFLPSFLFTAGIALRLLRQRSADSARAVP